MVLSGKKIAFLGDSITEGVGATSEDKIYHQVLKSIAGLDEAVNYGISGTRIANQKFPSESPETDYYFASRVDGMRDDVDAVVVFGGTNDYGHGDAPFGTFADNDVDTFYGACHVLMQKLINKYPDKPIVFMTPLHRINEMDSMANGIPKNLTLSDYVYALREVAEYYSVPVLDLYASGGMQPNVEVQNKHYFADGLHPNDNGHAQIANKLKTFLESL